MEEETSASGCSSDEEERPILKMNHSPSGRGRLTCLTRLVPPLSPRKTGSFLPSTGREGYPPPTFANANERDTGERRGSGGGGGGEETYIPFLNQTSPEARGGMQMPRLKRITSRDDANSELRAQLAKRAR